jgi:hypothetical protein
MAHYEYDTVEEMRSVAYNPGDTISINKPIFYKGESPEYLITLPSENNTPDKAEYSRLLLECYRSGQMTERQYQKHVEAGDIKLLPMYQSVG